MYFLLNKVYFSIFVAEMHAIGLKHPFDGSTVLPSVDDNIANTVMSYSNTGNSAGTPGTSQ